MSFSTLKQEKNSYYKIFLVANLTCLALHAVFVLKWRLFFARLFDSCLMHTALPFAVTPFLFPCCFLVAK